MPGARLPLALRFALRELRGGLSGFYIFVACIALGVAAIAGVNSVSRALTEGIAAEGRVILGGDLAFSLIHRQASPEELRFFQSHGDVGRVATLRAMARQKSGDAQTLVEMKAVDAAYPHGGTILFEDGGADIQARMARQDGVFGAIAAPQLYDRLGLKVGDRILIGEAELELRGVLRSEPDALSSGLGFGPRLIVPLEALPLTGLVRPGSLITWIYRIRMPGENDGAAIARVKTEAEQQFPQAGWSIRTRFDASPGLTRNIDRFSQFLTLVGLTALVVGGVGVANAVASYIDLKRPAIATFKCLGASGSLVFRIYLIQILILAGFGILIGLVVGAALPFIAKAALANLLPVRSFGLYPRELVIAVVYGFLVTVSFALAPLGRARQMPATSLFADRAVASPVRPPIGYRASQYVAFAALAALAILSAADNDLALTYVVSVVAAFLVLRVVALGIMRLAQHLGTVRGTALRLAVRNIHRPGALTPSVVLSLGLGLSLLVGLALIDSNLRRGLAGDVADKAPDFFFLDIQDSERDDFLNLVRNVAPGGGLETAPMLRGRFVAIKGVPVAKLRPGEGASWALRGDRGITYADSVPANSTLIEGKWWPAGYDGEPLVSMEKEIADGLKVKLGDTITVNVLGRNIEARVANLRRVNWESLSINFVMVFSPNTFRGAPHAHLATLRLAKGGRDAEKAVLSAVTRSYPGITTVSVRDAIDSVNAILGQLLMAVRVAASLALFVSVLVLGGALAAGHRQRRQDAVILKTLGATRRQLLLAFSLEYGLLGLATAIFATAAGASAAWYVVTRLMELSFRFEPAVVAGAILVALAVTLGLGLAGTWRILSVKPAFYLKNL